MTWHDGLTEKQRRFVEAYAANGGNATDAARKAGYRQPHPQGAENMQKPTVRAAIEALRAETTTSAILTREERQAYWTRVIRGEERDPDGRPPATRDRLRASELLARSQGDFLDRTEVSTADGSLAAALLAARARWDETGATTSSQPEALS
jgi:phage terminase small subunit